MVCSDLHSSKKDFNQLCLQTASKHGIPIIINYIIISEWFSLWQLIDLRFVCFISSAPEHLLRSSMYWSIVLRLLTCTAHQNDGPTVNHRWSPPVAPEFSEASTGFNSFWAIAANSPFFYFVSMQALASPKKKWKWKAVGMLGAFGLIQLNSPSTSSATQVEFPFLLNSPFQITQKNLDKVRGPGPAVPTPVVPRHVLLIFFVRVEHPQLISHTLTPEPIASGRLSKTLGFWWFLRSGTIGRASFPFWDLNTFLFWQTCVIRECE